MIGATLNIKAVARASLALAMACGVSAGGAEWTTHRGNPQRTGAADTLGGPTAPNVLWVYRSAEHFVASPVPGVKRLYTAGLGAFNTGVFHAISTARDAGERVAWSRTAPYINRPTVCAPAVTDGLIVFGDGMHQTDDAKLYCLQASTGMPVWQYVVPGKLVHIEGAPTVSKGCVFVGAGAAGILCVDLNRVTLDGAERTVADVIPLIARRQAELRAAYERDRKADPQLAIPPSLDDLPTAAPKLLWQKGAVALHVDAPLAVAGDLVLAASAYLDDENVGKRVLVCLKASNGATVWQTPLKINPWAGPTVAGKIVLVGCSSIRFDTHRLADAAGEVVAMDLASGKILWRQDAGGGILSSVAVSSNRAVYACTDGKVVARDLASGKLAWSYNAGKPFFAAPAIADGIVYAADLSAVVHAVNLADGKLRWKLDVAADRAVQSRTAVFGSPVLAGGDLYLATCDLEGQADQPSVVVCLSDTVAPAARIKPITVNTSARTISVPCRIAPRKLASLKEIYPLEVVASLPAPRGLKAHETIVTFDVKPSDVHKALLSLGLTPGKPAKGVDAKATGPEVSLFLEYTGITGRPRRIPIDRTLVDTRTGRPMGPLRWHFTGSVMTQPDPNKPARVYGADLSGTLVSLFPVTDETVLQSNMTLAEEALLKLDTNRNVLPAEGTEVKLILWVQ